MSKISSITSRPTAGFKISAPSMNRSLALISAAKMIAQKTDPNKWRRKK